MKTDTTRGSLRRILEQYCNKGFHLIPCASKSKKPLINNYNRDASSNMEKVMEWAKKYPGCNWAFLPSKSGHIIIDVDIKKNGLETWKNLIATHGDPITLVQRTGSGGLHYVFKARPGAKYKGKIDGDIGIDVRLNNYIIVYPSVHANGVQYKWEKTNPPAEIPDWVHAIFERKNKEKSESKINAGIKYFEEIANQLKEKPFDYGTWVQIGMALHCLFPNEDGLNLWKIASSGVNFQEGDLEKCDYKWETFKDDREDGVSERSFLFIARKFGCEIPDPLKKEDLRLFKEHQEDLIAAEKEENPEWYIDHSSRLCSLHKDFIIKWINDQGNAILIEEPRGKIVYAYPDKDGLKKARTMGTEDFKTIYKDRFYKYWEKGANGFKAKYRPIADLWLEHHERNTFSRVSFNPTPKAGELGLWSPIPCTPIKGDVAAFEELIEKVFCRGNKQKAQWFIKWLAHIVQFPSVKSTIVPVIIGDQGTGKGLLADGILAGMLKGYYHKVMTSQILKERFNAEQSMKLITVIDEASWAGDRQEANLLKALTGSDRMVVEEKFGGRYLLENYSRYLVLSNNKSAVAVERSNRRYLLFMLDNAYASKKEFFAPLWDQIRKGDLVNSIFDYLLNVDLSSFDAFTLPEFDFDGEGVKVSSEGSVSEFWFDFFFENPRELFIDGNFLPTQWVFNCYNQFAKEIRTWEKGITVHKFMELSGSLIPEILHRKGRKQSGNLGQMRGIFANPEILARSFVATLKINWDENFDEMDFLYLEKF